MNSVRNGIPSIKGKSRKINFWAYFIIVTNNYLVREKSLIFLEIQQKKFTNTSTSCLELSIFVEWTKLNDDTIELSALPIISKGFVMLVLSNSLISAFFVEFLQTKGASDSEFQVGITKQFEWDWLHCIIMDKYVPLAKFGKYCKLSVLGQFSNERYGLATT